MLRAPSTTAAIVGFALACSAIAAGQAPVVMPQTNGTNRAGTVLGSVIDSSAGVMPGVTVVAASPDGRVLATTVTDEQGAFAFFGLPSGQTTLRFELEGFDSVTTTLIVEPAAEAQVVERLDLAPLSEVVEVHGVAPPEPVSPPLPPPRQIPVKEQVRIHDRDTVCGPAKPNAEPEALATIVAGPGGVADALFTSGAEVVLDAGLDHGLDVGRTLVVRRRYRVPGDMTAHAVREHSAGVLQIVESGPRSSVGIVVYACEELRTGDFVASFDLEVARETAADAAPDFNQAARILFADEGQALGAPRRLMVIARGTSQGAVVGERLTLFRQAPGAPRRVIVGNAVVMTVRADSSTIRIDRVTDAIAVGDWAAPHVAPASLALSLR